MSRTATNEHLAEGVAPLGVHFSAEFSGSTDSDRGFLSCEYSWDFGDSDSGTWGTTGKSKNVAKGGIAEHVFENPGNYTVSLTVRNGNGVIGTETFTVKVEDPDTVYSGTNTICVCDSANADFSKAPSGALCVTTDDLSTITKYATVGKRVLFHRGSSWTTAELSWAGNAGPVTIGAFGTGTNPDAYGIYDNAPQITMTSGTFLSLTGKQDWRVMDLRLLDSTRSCCSFGGASNMQRILLMRLKVEGFKSGIEWTHYNASKILTIDEMAIVSCELSEAAGNVVYAGGERIAVQGNLIYNARDSHTVRIWQAYKGVISNNIISGSSLDNSAGRHAFKLHGPGTTGSSGTIEYGTPTAGTTLLAHYTQYVVVSDNVFGAAGPWPVSIGPQNAQTNTLISDVVFERNRIVSDYGVQSSMPVQIGLLYEGQKCAIRNNVFDGTGDGIGPDYTAISVGRRGIEPKPQQIEIYNNTIYRQDNGFGNKRVGISISEDVSDATVMNNLVSFPNASVPVTLISNSSTGLVASNNLLIASVGFIDPNNSSPLLRDFSLQADETGIIDKGIAVPVFEDFLGQWRYSGKNYDVGACER
jgi:PKD repeat protein